MNILTEHQLQAINTQFGLSLDYNDATHYRAAQIIYTLWKEQDTTSERMKISSATPDASENP
jgi:hypothetical protein